MASAAENHERGRAKSVIFLNRPEGFHFFEIAKGELLGPATVTVRAVEGMDGIRQALKVLGQFGNDGLIRGDSF